jgi:hypothetical protein
MLHRLQFFLFCCDSHVRFLKKTVLPRTVEHIRRYQQFFATRFNLRHVRIVGGGNKGEKLAAAAGADDDDHEAKKRRIAVAKHVDVDDDE